MMLKLYVCQFRCEGCVKDGRHLYCAKAEGGAGSPGADLFEKSMDPAFCCPVGIAGCGMAAMDFKRDGHAHGPQGRVAAVSVSAVPPSTPSWREPDGPVDPLMWMRDSDGVVRTCACA